jgi:hypothetical protein
MRGANREYIVRRVERRADHVALYLGDSSTGWSVIATIPKNNYRICPGSRVRVEECMELVWLRPDGREPVRFMARISRV